MRRPPNDAALRRQVKRHALVTLAVVAGALCAVQPVSAQGVNAPSRPTVAQTAADSALEARTTAVASTLRCPVCQGESIQDSPSDLARQMRAVVRDKLRAGETPDEVKAYFASKYGEWILLEPTMKGLNIMLYAIPVLLVVGGLGLVAFLVRRWTSPETTTP
jgi:cytochrome c-type biogenesis protein CcmH/NrfF